jgi:hypothetical protein
MEAAREGHTSTVQALLAAGAEINFADNVSAWPVSTYVVLLPTDSSAAVTT